MDTKIENGDFATNNRGLPQEINGKDELLQRIRLCAAVPKGSFSYAPLFGSRLHLLGKTEHLQERALAYVKEAVMDCKEVELLSVTIDGSMVTVKANTPFGIGETKFEVERNE